MLLVLTQILRVLPLAWLVLREGTLALKALPIVLIVMPANMLKKQVRLCAKTALLVSILLRLVWFLAKHARQANTHV